MKPIVALLLAASLLVQTLTGAVRNRPDAIRCSADGVTGAYFLASSVSETSDSYYCQVAEGDGRCVIFRPDGSYSSGTGPAQSRRGCENKSLEKLKQEKRTKEYADQSWIIERFLRLEKLMAEDLRNQQEQSKNMEKNNRETENKVRLQAERIQKLENELKQLKMKEIQRLKDEVKNQLWMFKETCMLPKHLGRAISEYQNDIGLKLERLINQTSETKSNHQMRIEKLQTKSYFVRLEEIDQKLDRLRRHLEISNDEEFNEKLEKMQRDIRINKIQIFKKVAMLEFELSEVIKEKERPRREDYKKGDIELKAPSPPTPPTPPASLGLQTNAEAKPKPKP